MGKISNLTVKGQVTIPKDVRDALGLRPNEPVEFDWNADGEAVIRKPAASEAGREQRRQAILARLDEAAKRFAHLSGQGDPDALMAIMREPVPLADLAEPK